MCSFMKPPRIELFDWLLSYASMARYNLAYSNVQGLTLEEYQRYTDFSVPLDFDFGINASAGAPELKKTLCSIYDCPTDAIVTTTGASEANFLVFSSLLGPGDEFLIEQPGYQPLWLTPEMLGARRINWSRDFQKRFRVDVEVLQGLITRKTKLVVLTNLHNPSGVLTERTSLERIATIAEEHGAYVLIDEIFLDGADIQQASSFGLPNVIVTSSTTKVYGIGGLHCGWIVAPKIIATQCQRLKAHSTGAASYFSEIMTAHLLQDARRDLIERFHRRSQTNLNYLEKWMNHHAEWFEWVRPDGGLLCFPKYTIDTPSVEFCLYLLRSQKLLVCPGSFFNQEGFIRISCGCDEIMFREALDRLENGLECLHI
jgi:aspartate/methionine/tyrosine aminotransferase